MSENVYPILLEVTFVRGDFKRSVTLEAIDSWSIYKILCESRKLLVKSFGDRFSFFVGDYEFHSLRLI